MPVVNYIWDELDDNVKLEMDDAGNTITMYENEPSLYGEANSQTRNGVTSYFHFDGLGSTRAMTDENQNVTDTSTYSAFGDTVDRVGATFTPYHFKGASGYQTNTDTDNLYIRRRTYRPDAGRWNSVDPLGLSEGVNAYEYCFNSPISCDDPSGLAGMHSTVSCAGPPKNLGANYIPGRGRFTMAAWFNPHDEDESPFEPPPRTSLSPMGVILQWTPSAESFMDEDCECCCTKIGWVQIVSTKTDYQGVGSVAEIADFTEIWHYDGGVPYPGGIDGRIAETNPCTDAETITHADTPERFGGVTGARLRSFVFTAETCVFCIEGNEGWTRTGYSGFFSSYREDRFTIYGCAKWGFRSTLLQGTSYLTIVDPPARELGPPTLSRWEDAAFREVPVPEINY